MLTRRSISAGLTAAVLGGAPLAATRGRTPSPIWPNAAKAAVSLTYDDGLNSQLDNAAAALEAVRLRATFFLTLENMDARLKDWVELAKAGHEFGHHTVTHPCDLRGYTPASFARREIVPMQAYLDAHFGPNPARLYAYPCSATDLGDGGPNRQRARYEALLKAAGLHGARTCDEDAPNSPGYARRQPYRLRASATTADQDDPNLAIAYVQDAMTRGDWAILVFHDVLKSRAGPGDTSIASHETVLRWLIAQPVWCAPMGEVLGHIAGQPT